MNLVHCARHHNSSIVGTVLFLWMGVGKNCFHSSGVLPPLIQIWKTLVTCSYSLLQVVNLFTIYLVLQAFCLFLLDKVSEVYQSILLIYLWLWFILVHISFVIWIRVVQNFSTFRTAQTGKCFVVVPFPCLILLLYFFTTRCCASLNVILLRYCNINHLRILRLYRSEMYNCFCW